MSIYPALTPTEIEAKKMFADFMEDGSSREDAFAIIFAVYDIYRPRLQQILN
jgi:hypothetical protein